MPIDILIWNKLLFTFGHVGIVTFLLLMFISALFVVVYPRFAMIVSIPLLTIMVIMAITTLASGEVLLSLIGLLSIVAIVLLIVKILIGSIGE